VNKSVLVNLHLKARIHWQICTRKHQQYHDDILLLLLALANRNDPISVTLPKVAKASSVVTVAVTVVYWWHYRAKLRQWKN
jgi:hypothetical protein